MPQPERLGRVIYCANPRQISRRATFARDECRVRLHPGMTPRIASRALHALILGLFNDWLRDPRLFDPDTDAEHLLEPMFRGLVRDWGQASSAP